jgi:hypothetical protein
VTLVRRDVKGSPPFVRRNNHVKAERSQLQLPERRGRGKVECSRRKRRCSPGEDRA